MLGPVEKKKNSRTDKKPERQEIPKPKPKKTNNILIGVAQVKVRNAVTCGARRATTAPNLTKKTKKKQQKKPRV